MIAILLKSSVALLLGLMVVVAARHSRASLRHLILAALFIFLLLLPVVQRFAPAVEIPVQAPSIAAVAASPAVEVSPAAEPPVRTASSDSRRTLLSFLPQVYAAGTVLLLAHLLIGILRLRTLAARAEVWLDGTARMNEIAHQADIRRAALVVLSRAVAVPMTFGFVRSTIVLPDGARHWPADELTRALRHELEHVRREDWVLQLAARAACALYWPQPLVWIAWRRFCLEAERACDDAVLGTSEAAAYAGQLVELARHVHRSSMPVLGMASRSKLGTRIEAILDATQRRGPHSRYAAAAVVIALVGLLVSVAPARLIAAATATAVSTPDAADPEAPRGTEEPTNSTTASDDDISPLFGEALVKAAEAGDIHDVARLLDAGISVDTVAPGDGTALIGAARGGQMHMIDYLLRRGADPNVHSPGDGSPLIAAAREGYEEIVALLLDRGARIDDVVLGDENALMQAAMNGRLELVRLLIDRGANVNARSVERSRVRTPLSLARQYGHVDVARLLVRAGAVE